MTLDKELAKTARRVAAEKLEKRCWAGCTQCGAKLYLENPLRPAPGVSVVYRQRQDGIFDEGEPYCGRCMHLNGWACEPGNDYII